MDRRKRLIVPSRQIQIPERRQFFKSVAALGAGAFAGVAAGGLVLGWNRATYAGGAGNPQAWCNTLNPGFPWCYNYDTHYSYLTRYGDLHIIENGGEADWNTVVINGETYLYSICEEKYDATYMLYWDNFGFDFPLPSTDKLKALHVRLIAESFQDEGNGARTQPKSGDQIKICRDVANMTAPRVGGAIDAVHDHGWQGTVQPFIKGGRSWRKNLWTKSQFSNSIFEYNIFECCGPVSASCPQGADCPCDSQELCDDYYCTGTSGYCNPGYWGATNNDEGGFTLTVAQAEDSKFGLSIQVTAKNDGQYFRVRIDPAPEIRIYW